MRTPRSTPTHSPAALPLPLLHRPHTRPIQPTRPPRPTPSRTHTPHTHTQVPAAGLWQISATVFAIEVYRIRRVIRGENEPGDLGLGQGGFNPFGFNYSEEEYREKQVGVRDACVRGAAGDCDLEVMSCHGH